MPATGFFKGILDEVAIFNAPLAKDDIVDIGRYKINTKKCMTIVIAIILVCIITAHPVLAKEVPPKNRMVVKQEFKNVADNSWSNLELEQSEPSGLYYIKMTDVKGSWGSWGSKKDPYPE